MCQLKLFSTSEMNSQLVLPKGFSLLETQVAGHTYSPKTKVLGLLKDKSSGCVLKPMGKLECGKRETNFYAFLQTTTDPMIKKLRCFVPKFYGTVDVEVNGKEHTFLKLEDLTHGMRKPCIMDIKVGKRTWDPMASAEKQIVEEQKYSQCKKALGVCLPGFQVYTSNGANEEILLRYGKEYGKELNADGFRTTIEQFLHCRETCQWPVLLNQLLQQLHAIRDWFNEQRTLHFYASSLLIAYDYENLQPFIKSHNSARSLPRDTSAVIPGDSKEYFYDAFSSITSLSKSDNIRQFIKVRMIDFAHVYPSIDRSADANYMFGLENLINILENQQLSQISDCHKCLGPKFRHHNSFIVQR